MKKSFLKVLCALFVVAIATTNLSAQGAYVKLNLGYGFNAGAQSDGFKGAQRDGANSTRTDYGNTTTINEERVNLSFGKGLNLGGVFGYMFNKNIGAELGLSYLIGATTDFTDIRNSTNSSSKSNDAVSANMLRFMPTLVLATGMEKFNPYAKFGFVLGSGSINHEYNETSTNNSNTSVFVEKTKFNGGLAFGYTAAVGANYPLSDKLSLFGELNLISMSYAPTTGEITEASTNGVNALVFMTTRDKFTDFVDEINYQSNAPTNNGAPREALKSKYPFSSFGVNVGVKYSF